MIDNQRLNILFQAFVASPNMPEEHMEQLSLEELSFIYAACEASKKNEKLKEINYPVRQQIIYWAAVDALKKAEKVYVAYTKQPMYPYVGPNGSAWLFSTEETGAKLAEDFKKHQHMELVLREIENKMILPMMASFYYLGIGRVLIDNGTHPIMLNRTDIQEDPAEQEGNQIQNFQNGDLQRSMIQFFQFAQVNRSLAEYAASSEASEEEKKALGEALPKNQQVSRILETNMLAQLIEAKFLVPMVTLKDGKPVPPGQPAQGEGVSRKIANLVDSNQVSWLPVFTDWPEFMKVYKPTEWGAMVMTYEALSKFSADSGIKKIVFNPRGCALRADEKLLDNIETFRQKLAEAKENAQKNGQEGAKNPEAAGAAAAKKMLPVTYGELDETPEMMITALKRTAKALHTVKYMWLAGRTQGNEKGYLLVAEITSDEQNTLDELKRASAGYLDGKEMEIRKADTAALEIVNTIKPFYKRGFFG